MAGTRSEIRRPPVFVAAFNVSAAVTAVVWELINGAASGVVLRVRRVRLYNNVASSLTLKRTTGVTAGGTSTAMPTAALDSAGPACTATGLVFTVDPTDGTGPTVVFQSSMGVVTFDFNMPEEPIAIRPGQNLEAYNTVANSSQHWSIYWTEEPV